LVVKEMAGCDLRLIPAAEINTKSVATTTAAFPAMLNQ